MQLKKIVAIFYCVYTFYILLVCWLTDISALYIVPGLLALWTIYGFFAAGDRLAGRWVGRKPLHLELPRILCLKPALRGFFWACGIVLAVMCSVLAIHFYTGQWPGSVVSNLHSGVSNYYIYQYYFKEHGALSSVFARLPYILMTAFSKFIFIYGVISWCQLRKCTPRHLVMASLCCLGQVYISLGRGTNFEIYELTILVVFIVLKKCRFELSLRQFGRAVVKPLMACLAAGLCLVCVYYIILGTRHFYATNVYVSQDIHYAEGSLPAQLLPELSLLVLNLFGYLGFGLYYISSFINRVMLRGPVELAAAFCPMGYRLLMGESTSDIMERTIDIGVMWHPDFINAVDCLGLVGTLLLIALLGFFCGRLERSVPDAWTQMAGYLLLLQMLSFPVGNFVMCSSANQLLICLLIAVFLLKPLPSGTLASSVSCYIKPENHFRREQRYE